MPACYKCGTTLGGYGPAGLCPKCMLLDGIGNEGGSRFGDYELVEQIAHGGMGVVWKARQISLDRTVAVKLMLAGSFANADHIRRFRTEAEAAASLQHPNIVAIHEIGEHDGQPFFSMDFVEGQSLAQLVRDQSLPAKRAAAYLKTIAEAVQYAHRHGILHRDLKPSNILIDALDQPRITDFGLAKRFVPNTRYRMPDFGSSGKAPASGIPDLTLPGQVLGSPNYLPPEQAEGRHCDVSPASDVYSLGAVLYCLLTGHAPFQAATVADTLKLVSIADPVSPRLLNPSVPCDLETICLRCLEKEISRRYRTAQELTDELDRFLKGLPILARPVNLMGKSWRWCLRRPVRAALIAALVFVTTLGLVGVLSQWRRAQRHAAASEQALWRVNFEHAHALRVSGRMGQRLQALAAISNAAALRPAAELRTETLAALALLDLEDSGVWHPLPSGLGFLVLDGRGERAALAVLSNRVEVRQVADGALLAVMTNRPVSSWPSFSRDGSRLAVSGPECSVVWDVSSGRTLLESAGHTALALSPNGKQLLYVTPDRGIILTDLDRHQEITRLNPAIQPSFISFSPQGDYAALWRLDTIEVWHLMPPRKEGELRLPGDIQGLDWQPDGSALAIGCVDHFLYVWSWRDGLTNKLTGHLREGISPHYHPGGDLLASGAFDGTLFLWDPHIRAPLLTAQGLGPLGFSADGQWLTVLGPRGLGRLRVHRPAESRLLHTGIAENQHRWVLDFSPNGRWLAGLNGENCIIWETLKGQAVWRQPLPDSSSAVFLNSDTLLTASQLGVQQWNRGASTGPWKPRPPITLIQPLMRPDHIFLSHDRRRLLAGVAGAGAIFDLPQTTNQAGTLRGASLPMSVTEPRLWLRGQPLFGRPVLSPDGQWIASGYWNHLGGYGSALWLWSALDGRPVREIPFGCCSPDFSPDGRWLLVSGGSEYRLYAVTGPPLEWREVWREPRLANTQVPGLACFARHRNWLALQADERLIRLLEVESRRELARFTPLASQLWALAWSADGRWLAASSAEHGTQLWDLDLLRARLRELGLDWE